MHSILNKSFIIPFTETGSAYFALAWSLFFQPLWSSPSRALLLSQGYCEDAQATANAFCGDFYLTGDRGVQDEVKMSISEERGSHFFKVLLGWLFLVLLPGR